MGYRPQGSQQGAYGQQPELRPGVPVTSADGQWKGTVVEVLPAGRGYEGTVRVQWEGYGLTYVTLGMLGYDNGHFVVRSEGGQAQSGQAAQAAQAGQQAQQAQNVASTNAASATDAAAVNNRIAVEQAARVPDDRAPLSTNFPNTPQPQQRGETAPTYPTPAPRGDDATRFNPPTPAPTPTYNPRPVERVEADEMTRLAPEAVQMPSRVTPQPPPQPAYPNMQEMARPVSSYYPESPPLPVPDTAEQRSAAEPAYVVEPAQAEVVVPIIEEYLTAQPEWREAGNVTVRTVTEEVPQSFTQEVEREEAFVERVTVGRVLAEGETPEPRQEGDTFIMPVIVEEAVIVIQRVLAEEVHVTKRIVQNTQTVETTVRRQRAEVDAGTLDDRVHDERPGS